MLNCEKVIDVRFLWRNKSAVRIRSWKLRVHVGTFGVLVSGERTRDGPFESCHRSSFACIIRGAQRIIM